MPDVLHYSIMGFGALVVCAGLALLFYGKATGDSSIEIWNAKFQVSTPALVVFLVGAGLFVLPVLVELPEIPRVSDGEPRARPTPSSGPPAAEPQRATTKEIEPNNHISDANLIALGDVIRGTLHSGDIDYFQIDPRTDGLGRLRVIVRRLSGDAHIELRIFDRWEKQLGPSFDVFPFAVGESVRLEAEPGMTYYVRLSCCGVVRRGTMEYELTVREEA